MGRLIVIEGLDSSGKATQSRLLYNSLKAAGYKVRHVEFPDYKSPSSSLVKMYLAGDFGKTADAVSPYAASTFYAADRYASFKTDWGSFYNDGGIIIADRYTTSNMIHQAGKLESSWEKDSFLSWLCDFEYRLYGIPSPDLVIFLNMPPEVSATLMQSRLNKATGEQQKDIHEKDMQYLIRAYNNACDIAKKYSWTSVKCINEEALRTIEDIADEVLNITINELKK